MATYDVSELANGDDAKVNQDGTGYTSDSGGYLIWQRHVNTALATSTGFRFQIPSTIDPDDITAVELRVTAINAGTVHGDVLAERTPAAAWADNTTNRPINRWNTAISGGSTAVAYDIGSTTSTGTVYPSGNLATDVIAAMNDGGYTPGTSYVGVIFKADIGGPEAIQFANFESSTSGYRPILRITYTPPTVNGSITTTAPAVTAQVAKGAVTFNDVNYDYDNSRTVLSPGGVDRRVVDINLPWDTKPAGGYPVVAFVHGGSFVGGDEDARNVDHMQDALNRGKAFVSISYGLATDIDGYSGFPTHPMPRQDIGVCLQYLVDDWDIDTNEIILTGYSAGAHIALEYLLTYNDTANYTRAYDGPSGARVNSEPETGTTFDFDQNHGAQPKPKALFLWAGPLDLTVALYYNSLLQNALRGYMGGDSSAAFSLASTNHEQDLNYLAAGTAGTPYAGAPHYTRLYGVPIGYIEARWGAAGYSVPTPPAVDTAEETVVPASGIEVLKTVLTDAGIPNTPNSSTVNGLNLSGGLSHYRHRVYVGSFGSFPHDTVYAADNFTSITRVSDSVAADYYNWMNWLESAEFVTATAPAAAFTVPTPSVTTGGTNGSITTTAPSVAFSRAATASVSDGVTTTAPAATFSRAATASVSDGITTTAPSVALAASATAQVSDGVTTTAPAVALAPITIIWNLYGSGVYGSSAYVTSSDSPVTTTAPGVTLAAAATASVSDGVTTTAPAASVAAAATASVSDGVTTTAPAATFSRAATAQVSDGVTTTAPSVALTATATAAGFAPGSVTTTAPGATFTAAATASVSDGITTTAPSAGLTAAATASGATPGSVTTSAASAAFGVGTVMVTVSAGFQITAPAAALLASASASAGTAVTTIAPSAGFTANSVSLTQAGAVTTTAPRVLCGVGASTPLYVFNSRRVPGIRRPDRTHTSRRPDSGHTTPRP